MRIGIDARFYSQSGIGRYLRNLIANLKELDKENEYFIFLIKEDYSNFKETKNFKKVLSDIPWYGFEEQLKFPKILNKYKLDLVHFPHFNIPIFYKGKYVVTIHDLIHQKYNMSATTRSSFFYSLKHLAYNRTFSTAIKNSQKIITVSDYVKGDLIKTFNISKDKVVVTYEGIEKEFLEIAKKLSPKKGEEILKKFSIKPPYLFFIGSAHPHKNVTGLLEAFKLLRRNYQYLKLVLAGKEDYFWRKILKQVQNENIKDVMFVGSVSEEELVTLYNNAQVYVQPSFEEGFGLPVLESMSLGCPVVCSHHASLPEVAGDAAVFFDPSDIFDMSEQIKKVINDGKLKKELREKGLKRAKDFSFGKMTKQTLSVYNSII